MQRVRGAFCEGASPTCWYSTGSGKRGDGERCAGRRQGLEPCGPFYELVPARFDFAEGRLRSRALLRVWAWRRAAKVRLGIEVQRVRVSFAKMNRVHVGIQQEMSGLGRYGGRRLRGADAPGREAGRAEGPRRNRELASCARCTGLVWLRAD